jgi:hypothetical protein
MNTPVISINATDMILKSILLTSLTLLSYTVFYGQSGFPYDSEWKLVDSLINKKNLPKSALAEVNKIYQAAKKDNQEAQWIKAVLYRNLLQKAEDKAVMQTVTELENEIATAPPRVAAVLKSIEAEQLNQYLMENQYEIQNRTSIVSDSSMDITTWTIERMTKKIRGLYVSSINIPIEIQKTPIGQFEPVLMKGNSRELRPTLYDLLAWRALDYFQTDNRFEYSESVDELMENAFLFSEAPFFMHYDFGNRDSASNKVSAVKIYQQLLRFHAKDQILDAWIDADIKRIRFVYQYSVIPEKDSLYMNALIRITTQYPSLSVTSGAFYLEAQWWSKQASIYDPIKDSSHRYEYLTAVSICEKTIQHPESSEGKSDCKILLKNIKSSRFQIQSEQVNIPGQPFRLLVTYKNISHLYGRIIHIDDATRELFEQNMYDLNSWTRWLRLPVERSFKQSIPETADYQEHRVEIKADPLPFGQYALLISSDSSFSDQAIMGMSTFFCSSIAYVKNGMDYFVVDRDSGHPMQGVKVRSFNQKYTNAGYTYLPWKTYQTDQHGYFRLLPGKEYSNSLKLEFYAGKDYLSTTNYVAYYRSENKPENLDQKEFELNAMRDYIFTDRAIYRPGQTVYFKGLLVTRDFVSNKFKTVNQQEIKLYLVDANNEPIDSLLLKSNDFGSVQGSFKLPQNGLNGDFMIRDNMTQQQQPFSVEEYKRPSFYLEYDTLKDSYRVGDPVTVHGTALAYAGSRIDDAKLSWRVYRESRFPYPWLFRYVSAASKQEIAHGESVTDENGKFKILFTAIPDKSVNRSSKPVYSYQVETTVTSANGESRSETTSVSASYQSYEIFSSLPDMGRISRDSLYQIPVTTKNNAGVFLKESLTVAVYPLKGPDRLIRKRYWTQPDQFVMTASEYLKAFPYDEYDNESDVKSWYKGAKIFEKTDSTREDGVWVIGKKQFESVDPGWYVFEFRGRDKNGEEILDKKFLELTGNSGKPSAFVYNLIPAEMKWGEPGETVRIQTGSDAKDLFVIRSRQNIPDTSVIYSYYNLNQQINSTAIEIREADRGGFALNDVFVKNNRWYSSRHTIQVPWTNKELQISYQTWKDKTLPGSREQWKIKISGYKKDMVSAEILSSMYDASLDQFKMQAWDIPDLDSVYRENISWNADRNFDDAISAIRRLIHDQQISVVRNSYDAIINPGTPGGAMNIRIRGMASYNLGISSSLGDMDDVVVKGFSPKKKNNAPPVVEVDKFELPSIVIPQEERAEEKSPAIVKTGGKEIQIRKNFNETAFFLPDLKTDSGGNVVISFAMPDALTRWKWMVLANTKDLSFGYSEKTIITQKELMLQTNMPRFFREGDTMLLPVKIANLSPQIMSGTVQLQWFDAGSNQPLDREMGNLKTSQPFTVNASQSIVIFFPVVTPAHFTQPVMYRIIAKAVDKVTEHSDGEEAIIPVLSNRMLVTESFPLNLHGNNEENFVFEKLVKSGTFSDLQNQSLTVEYASNPAWYAVQSLPYLMEFPYECTEQTFNRFYANALATHIVQVSPAMKEVFEKWENADTATLISNLQKNEELKSVLLRETPWVLEARTETQQKKNLALLFDLLKMQRALKSALDKLQGMQTSGNGFPWFKGGNDDQYITQYIISGIGRLRKLKAVPADLQFSLDKIARQGIAFLDKEIKSDYEKRDKQRVILNPDQIQYLYMRSFFPDISVPGTVFSAMNYYRKAAVATWTSQPVYMQGMIALFLSRTGDIRTAKDILASLKENATNSPELGMYWKSNQYGYYWQEAPVETQSLLIEVFQELHAEQKNIDQMKYWLLQQKRTSHWPTTKATADACYALLLTGSDWLSAKQNVTIKLGGYTVSSSEEKTEAGTGYFKKQIPGEQVNPDMGNISITLSDQPPSPGRQPSSPSWGAVYWQYFENLDHITSAQTGISINKQLFREINSDKGPVLETVSPQNGLKPGDKLVIRLIIKTDRDLEYVHVKDMRAACLEPVNVLSGYKWQNRTGYYETTQDASSSFFFDRLPKGNYVFEYPVFVTTAGDYSNGISSLESMYAPEFAAHSEGIRVQVVSK